MKILNLLIKNAIKLWGKNGKSWDPVAKTFVELMQAQCWENVKRYLEKAQQYKSRRLFFENITFVTILNSWGFRFTCPNQSPLLDYVHKNRAFQPCYQQWKGSQTGDDLIWKACWRIGAQVVTAPHGLGRRRREENGPRPKKLPIWMVMTIRWGLSWALSIRWGLSWCNIYKESLLRIVMTNRNRFLQMIIIRQFQKKNWHHSLNWVSSN